MADEFEETIHEVTVKLNATTMVSLERAIDALKEELDGMYPSDGFALTLKFTTGLDVTDEVESMQSLFREHRGVKANISHKITTKNIEGDKNAPRWAEQQAFDVTVEKPNHVTLRRRPPSA